jgi:hypothetical protein
MLRICFKINHYELNLCNHDDDDDYHFLERISERYDYMLYCWHDHSGQYFKLELELDEGYDIKVALYDILSIIPLDSLEELQFSFCFYRPAGLYQ